MRPPSILPDSLPPVSVTAGFLRRITSPPVIMLLALIIAGCAARAPRIEDANIRRKLDLRLQMALEGSGVGESLGEYIRVIIRLKETGTDEDRQALSQFGAVGAMLGPVVTLTLKPEYVVQVAALPRVKAIEFDANNVPMPTPPPPPPQRH